MTTTKIPKLSSLIEARKLDYVSSTMTDSFFPEPKEIGTDFKLFHFDKNISSEDAVKEMEKQGYSPANAWELLSWKDWNRKDWLVCLGSVGEVDGSRRVPCLREVGSGRDLGLGWFDDDWSADCRFLGVRNSSYETKELEKNDLGDSGTLTLEARVKALEEWKERFIDAIKP